MADKLNDYFDAGVDVVWIVNPKRREISVYRSPSDVAVMGAGAILREERFLPGLELPVSVVLPSP
jgi:Uma2 family endonuclease